MKDLVRLPSRIVEGHIIPFQPQSSKDNGAKSHPDKVELIEFTRDPIRENPLLPSEGSLQANNIKRG
jgi:hypothetical protein